MKFPSLTVFFPAYNDAASLPALLEKTFHTLAEHVADYEVIVVNDGSRDNTEGLLEALSARYAPHLRVVTHETNRGYGAALRSGFAAAQKDFVFYTDGDGQYDPGELPLLLKEMELEQKGLAIGFVNGYKIARSDPAHRILIGGLYNFAARLLFRIRTRDVDCDFRLIRRSLLQRISLTSTSGTICVELVRKLEQTGCRFAEAPVHHYPRLHGRSQFFRVRPLVETFGQLFQLWMRLMVMR